MELFAGLDVSTQSCKLIVIDVDSAEVVFLHSVNYDRDLPEYGTLNGAMQGKAKGVSESEPGMWIKAVEKTFQQLAESGIPQNKIRSISVSGQQHGLVALDADGNLARASSKLWNDFSTLEECKILTERIGGKEVMINEVANSQRTGYTAPKILHMLRHEPEKFHNTSTFLLVHNFINWYLTGGVKIMEPGDASGLALWNPVTGNWSAKLLEAVHPDLKSKLPQVAPSDQSIGTIASALVERFGFDPQCKIDAGSGDNMYAAVGTGNIAPGLVTISLGTSGTACCILPEPFIDLTGEIASYADSTGNFLPLLCVSNMANGYNELIRRYRWSHEDFEKAAGQVAVGNEGRILIPWYEGERTPDVPNAQPYYIGFSLSDFTPEILARAVVEGHVQNLYYGFRRLPVSPAEIRLTGGLAQSSLWCQTIADIFEVDTVPVAGEGAALGAAIHAAWVWFKEEGQGHGLQQLVDMFVHLEESRRKAPIPENVAIYRRQKVRYRQLVDTIIGRSVESAE